MFSSVLIANRGEIARRILRTARRLGLQTIAVYTEADAATPFVLEADQAINLSPAPESYLQPEKILAAARASGAGALHPGYGFLAENADFAEAVLQAGLVWIGPPPAAIRAMGRKDAAKALMAKACVPVLPGYDGGDQSPPRLHKEAERLGYPVLIKAVAGGGGIGLRRVAARQDFAPALEACRREAQAAFGDDRVLLETFIPQARHIEVQVFGDRFGQLVHLFERDCSLQRRHQKVIEEAPAPGMTAPLRAALCDAALRAAKAVAYEGAGTVEFIADGRSGLTMERIWFLEMNTRLQVEHPVTEAVTGQDLVEWQFCTAAGAPLPLRQAQIFCTGHAIEARLYAENPQAGFLPASGKLTHFHLPGQNLRIDSAVEPGSTLPPFYDPMIAKLIAHAPSREAAARQLARACRGVEIWPLPSNAAFLAKLLAHPDFLAEKVETGFIEEHLGALTAPAPVSSQILEAAATARLAAGNIPTPLTGFRLNAAPRVNIRLRHGEKTHTVRLTPPWRPSPLPAAIHGAHTVVFEAGNAFTFTEATSDTLGPDTTSDGAVRAPMPGHVLSVAVATGEQVRAGAPLLVMEAMKMEMTLTAPFSGRIQDLKVQAGARVAEGVVLLHLTAGD